MKSIVSVGGGYCLREKEKTEVQKLRKLLYKKVDLKPERKKCSTIKINDLSVA